MASGVDKIHLALPFSIDQLVSDTCLFIVHDGETECSHLCAILLLVCDNVTGTFCKCYVVDSFNSALLGK